MKTGPDPTNYVNQLGAEKMDALIVSLQVKVSDLRYQLQTANDRARTLTEQLQTENPCITVTDGNCTIKTDCVAILNVCGGTVSFSG